MPNKEILRCALQAIRAHKLRSFLTLLGIIISVSTIVTVVGIISGLNTFVREKVIILSPDIYVVTRFGIVLSREEFLRALKRRELTWEEYQRLNSGVLSRASLVATRAAGILPVANGSRRLPNALVGGCTANFTQIMDLDTAGNGRFFTETEDRASQHVAVIGADVKDELFPRQDPLGRTLMIRGLPFRVIGHWPKEGRGPGLKDNTVLIPYQAFRKNFQGRNEIFPMDYFVRARGGVEGMDASIDETRAYLRALRHTPWRDADPVGFLTQDQIMDLWRQISTATFALLALVSFASLGIGGVVVMNIMLVSVAERTPEIGLRRAMGARKQDIRRQFLLEAALLSLAGGIIGVLLGGGSALTVQAVTGFPAEITPGIVLLGVSLSSVTGLLAGFLPASRASNLVVIDAIRAE